VLLTGEGPFSGTRSIDVQMKQRNEVTYPKDTDNGAKEFIQGCLNWNEAKRFTIAQVLNHRWLKQFAPPLRLPEIFRKIKHLADDRTYTIKCTCTTRCTCTYPDKWEQTCFYINEIGQVCFRIGEKEFENVTDVEWGRKEDNGKLFAAILTYEHGYGLGEQRKRLRFKTKHSRNNFISIDYAKAKYIAEGKYDKPLAMKECHVCQNLGGTKTTCDNCGLRKEYGTAFKIVPGIIKRRRMAVREFSPRRDSPVMVRLLREIVAANEKEETDAAFEPP